MIAQSLNLVDADVQELDTDVDGDVIRDVKPFIRMFNRHTEGMDDLYDLGVSLKEKQKNNELEVGYAEYKEKFGPVKESLSFLTSYTDEELESDPHSLTSLAFNAAKEDGVRERRVDRVLSRLVAGVPVLSQKEIDKRKKAGDDVTKFYNKSRAARTKDVNEILPFIKKVLLVGEDRIEEALEKLSSESSGRSQRVKKSRKTKTSRKVKDRVRKKSRGRTKENPELAQKKALGLDPNYEDDY